MNHFYNRIEIFNVEGRLVYSAMSSEKQLKLTTDEWAKGVYMVNVMDGPKLLASKKLIIQ